MEEYNERSNEEAVTDSQDEFNHGVCPMTPMSWDTKKK